MRFQKILLQSLALTLTNMGAILIAFGIYKLILQITSVNQRAVQTPLAIVLNIVLFALWTGLMIRSYSRYSLNTTGDYYLVYFAAGLWNPIIFIPLHYLTQGYMTSFGNIIVLWMYQVVVNLPVLALSWWMSNRLQTGGESG